MASLRSSNNNNPSSTRRLNTTSAGYSYGSSSSDDEDEEEALQEAALSKAFGEASEGRGGTKKRTATDQELKAAYEKTHSKRHKRPELTTQMLTGADGLIRIPTEFKQICFTNNNIAKYTADLVQAYQSFCADLMPSLHSTDTLLKIQQLAAKKDAKDFLRNMRVTARNQHVTNVLGPDRANQLLAELHEETDNNHIANEDAVGEFGSSPVATLENYNSDQEQEATFESTTTTNETSAATLAVASSLHRRRPAILEEDSDEEVEATFDDDSNSIRGQGRTETTAANNNYETAPTLAVDETNGMTTGDDTLGSPVAQSFLTTIPTSDNESTLTGDRSAATETGTMLPTMGTDESPTSSSGTS
jgi:hypothetical protein